MNEQITAVIEHESDDACIDLNPMLKDASRGTAVAEALIQFFEAAPAVMADGQSRVGASRLIIRRSGFRFE